MNIIMFGLLILISILCILLGKLISNSILHPIILMMIMWIGFIFFPLLFWNTGYKWNYNGLIWIMLSILSTEIGAILVKGKTKKTKKFEKYNKNYNWKIFLGIIILGIIAFLIQLSLSGFSLNNFASVDAIIDMNTKAAEQRYYGKQDTTFISQILLLFVYLSALCGGYSYNFAKTKSQKTIAIIGSFLPELGMMFFSNTKAGFIACCILWLAGWCVSYLFLNGKLPKIQNRYLIAMGIGLAAIIAILYFVMLLRTGDFSVSMRRRIVDKLWVYALGQVVNFDYWFENMEIDSLQFGLNNFMFVFKDLGMVVRNQGVYVDLLNGYGNIFTAFRGIICDYGVYGGLIYCFIRGAIIQYCIIKVGTRNIKTTLSACLVAGGYLWNIYGFIISPWIYNSYALAITGFGIFLLLVHRRIYIRKEKTNGEKD